ncbi:MAG TPA: peptidylprolyl isomerase [Draconibacterium sp.]|nr:peptidylprolyl isomerase [Draconibacterium sp.]
MKRFALLIVTALFAAVVSCGGNANKTNETIVSIKTDFGEIKVKLYNDTPKHKENLIKLIKDGFYDDLLFHRVINNFMIQGGDPNSKNAGPDAMLGSGGPGYTIPAEILPNHFHKKGALAAARLGGPKNPGKESSGSQFYIVQGRVFRPGELDSMNVIINNQRKEIMMREQFNVEKSKFDSIRGKNDPAGFNILVAELRTKVDSMYAAGPQFTLTDEQREIYSTVGGYPSLDGEYTVFGEVVEGLDVLDKIAAVNTNKANRPVEDVRMKIEIIK